MTTISLTDGNRVILKNGNVATEQDCCCCCMTLIPKGMPAAVYQEDWDGCWSIIWGIIKDRLEAAGWIVTIAFGEAADPDGNPMLGLSMTVTCNDCFDCDEWFTKVSTWTSSFPYALDNEPAGTWVDVQGKELNLCPGQQGPFFGYFAVSGCCGAFCGLGPGGGCEHATPATINGEGDDYSTWVPVCNPLP